MRLDRSQAALAHWCGIVASLKPGECIDISVADLRDINSYEHNDATFTPPDRILGNIMGSAYTHSYQLRGDTVTFIRHEHTGERRHNDPDHDFRVARLRRDDK